MTTRSWAASIVLVGGALTVGSAHGQTSGTTSSTSWAGQIDFGARATAISGDPARYQRFRDLRDGPLLQGLSLTRDTGEWHVDFDATNLGYRDSRFTFEAGRFGRVKSSVEFVGLPLFYSTDSATLYRETSPGTLVVDGAIRAGLQDGTLSLGDALASARSFELREQRNTTLANVVVAATSRTDVSFTIRETRRTGDMPWGGSFGFGNAVELAAPLDQRTTDATAAAEWANDRGSVRVAYDGSWFRNDIETLSWDNPLRVTDAVNAPAFGRASLFPSSTAHTVSGSGTLRLPRRTHASALVSLGSWSQDGSLLPFTTNTALPALQADRTSADADARITAVTSVLSSRPNNLVWLRARYRYYDFDNRTPDWTFQPGYVRFDSSLVDLTGSPAQVHSPYGYTRHFLDLDASVTPLPFVALGAGYGTEHDDRTGRYVESTADHSVRFSVDSTGWVWGTVRAVYEHSVRTGDGFDSIVLDEIGEQVSLRQFDISDRRRDRFTVLGTVTPNSVVVFNGAMGVGRDDRSDAEFGLQQNDHEFYNVGVDVVATSAVSFGFNYGFEHYTSAQRSRQALPFPRPCSNPPQAGCIPEFSDPRRDWTTDGEDRVHTASLTADVLKLVPQTDIRFTYDLSRARTRYTYVVPADTLLPPVNQLPALLNELHRAATDITYHVRRAVSVGLGYWYDRYVVDDFALGPATIDRLDLPGLIPIGYLNRPYRGHSAVLRVGYHW